MNSFQVLKIIDKEITNREDVKTVQQIQIIKQNFNEDARTISIEQILLHRDVKDLPIFVFVIGGKTRGGKSFLLNLMILYLESLENSNLNWWSRKVPHSFPWEKGPVSVTKGIWLYPKIFRINNSSGEEVGVLLMDMQGMYDDFATDGEIIKMSGLSALFSRVQFFNMKDDITIDYLESVITKLISGIDKEATAKNLLKENYKLVLIVRDWEGEELYPFGLVGGKSYLQMKMERVKNRQLWEVIQQSFNDIECVLLPPPGNLIKTPEFEQSGSLEMLEEQFLSHIQSFFEHIFHPDSLIVNLNEQVTGKNIYNILMRVDGTEIDENESFINVYTDNRNFDLMDTWINNFQGTLDRISYSEIEKAKREISKIIIDANKTFSGKSRAKYLEELKSSLETSFNRRIVDLYATQYNISFLEYIDIEHQQHKMWDDVKSTLLANLCGNEGVGIWKTAYLDFLKKCAEYYYHKLYESCKHRFQQKISEITKLEMCAGLDKKIIKSFKECADFEDNHPLWLKQYQCLKYEISELMLQKVGKITKIQVNIIKNLRRKQYEHFECFTLLNQDELNLDCVSPIDVEVIAKKVGYALFGPPGKKNVNDVATLSGAVGNTGSMATPDNCRQSSKIIDENIGFSEEQGTKIRPIVKKMINLSPENKVEFSCIFVVYNKNEDTVNVPIIRFKKGGNIIYIDSNGREYVKWNDFLLSNTLPDVVYCYPLGGRYVKEEEFFVAFSTTPASKTVQKVLEKGDTIGNVLTVGAGIGGGIIMCGVAAPLLVGATCVGAIAGGTYGMMRGVQKIMNKKKHNEIINRSNYINVALNGCAVGGVAGMALSSTVKAAAELVNISRTAAGFIGFSSLTSYLTNWADQELISFIADIEDSYLKVLFYFGSKTLADTLSVIRKYLKLEANSTKFEVLSALLENNSIEHAVERGLRGLTVDKYISQNLAELVTCIMKEISLEAIGLRLNYCKMTTLIDLFKMKMIRNDIVTEKTQITMDQFLTRISEECDITHQILGKQLSDNGIFSREFINMFSAKLAGEGRRLLFLGFRLLIWTLKDEMMKANKFFNTINHVAVQLNNHLDDVLCHPLCEIMQQVKEMLKQTESATLEFNIKDEDELNSFIMEILKIVQHNIREDWTEGQIYMFLEHISRDIKSGFERVISQHKQVVKRKEKVTCYDLPLIIEEIGMIGYNYGIWVSKQVLSDLGVDVSRGRREECDLLHMRAWDELMPNLYYYYSLSLNCDEHQLIKKIENVSMENYDIIAQDNGVTIYHPSTLDIVRSSTFVIYSGFEEGFILVSQNTEPDSVSASVSEIINSVRND